MTLFVGAEYEVPLAVQKYKPRVAARCKAMKQPGRQRKPDERVRRTHLLGTAFDTHSGKHPRLCKIPQWLPARSLSWF